MFCDLLVRLLSLLLVKPAKNDAGEAKVSAIHESASEWETPRRSDARFFSSLQVVAKLDFGVVAALYERRLTWAGPGFRGHRLPLQVLKALLIEQAAEARPTDQRPKRGMCPLDSW